MNDGFAISLTEETVDGNNYHTGMTLIIWNYPHHTQMYSLYRKMIENLVIVYY